MVKSRLKKHYIYNKRLIFIQSSFYNYSPCVCLKYSTIIFFYQHEIKYPNNFERNFVWPKKAKQISSTQLIIIQTTFIQICENSEPFVKNEPNIQCPIENVFSKRLFVKYVKTKSQQRQSY